MKAPVGDFPYVDMAVMQHVEFLCLLLLVRALQGKGVHEEGLCDVPLFITFGRATARAEEVTFGALVRATRLNFYRSGASESLTGIPRFLLAFPQERPN